MSHARGAALLLHLGQLLLRVFSHTVSETTGNIAKVFLIVVGALAIEFRQIRADKRAGVKTDWKTHCRNLGMPLAVWVLVFLGFLVIDVYDDHIRLVHANAELTAKLDQTRRTPASAPIQFVSKSAVGQTLRMRIQVLSAELASCLAGHAHEVPIQGLGSNTFEERESASRKVGSACMEKHGTKALALRNELEDRRLLNDDAASAFALAEISPDEFRLHTLVGAIDDIAKKLPK